MAIRDKLAELEKTAGPRKNEMRRSGRSDREYDDNSRYGKSRYYVGGRELDRRSRVHRSRSKERRHGTSKSSRRSRSRSRSKSYSSRRRSHSRDRR